MSSARMALLMANAPLMPRVPKMLALTARRLGIAPTRFLLVVNVTKQTLGLFEKCVRQPRESSFPTYRFRKSILVSTSAWGAGQNLNSSQTPLGLHRIARKIGDGQPIGTAFRSRRVVGLTWKGLPDATIVHRILWLEGLEPGFNRGGKVDTFRRYIYIHGFGDELTLGRPCSHGCIHVAAAELLPLFDLLPIGTLVWIAEN